MNKKFELAISKDYVSSWGVKEGIRELLQNAIDQEHCNKGCDMILEYDEKLKRLIIGNKDTYLDSSTLVLGNTSKANSTETIGHFGEGYKLATLALIRENKQVIFYNTHKESWEARFVNSRRFKQPILTFFVDKKTFKQTEDNNLYITVSPISPEEYKEISSAYLKLDEDVIETLDTPNGSVILNAKHAGNIYVGYLYVCNIKDLKYGYNLPTEAITLNRDRSLAKEFDILWQTSTIWRDAPDINLAKELIKQNVPDIKYLERMKYIVDTKLVNALNQDFKEANGKAIPVSNQLEADEASIRYPDVKQVMVSPIEQSMLNRYSNNYEDEEEDETEDTQKQISISKRLLDWFSDLKEHASHTQHSNFLNLVREVQELENS